MCEAQGIKQHEVKDEKYCFAFVYIYDNAVKQHQTLRGKLMFKKYYFTPS